jgi:hypothetical protein
MASIDDDENLLMITAFVQFGRLFGCTIMIYRILKRPVTKNSVDIMDDDDNDVDDCGPLYSPFFLSVQLV